MSQPYYPKYGDIVQCKGMRGERDRTFKWTGQGLQKVMYQAGQIKVLHKAGSADAELWEERQSLKR